MLHRTLRIERQTYTITGYASLLRVTLAAFGLAVALGSPALAAGDSRYALVLEAPWLADDAIDAAARTASADAHVKVARFRMHGQSRRREAAVTGRFEKHLRLAALRDEPDFAECPIGEKEAAIQSVSVRHAKKGDLGVKPLAEFLESITREVAERSL